MTLYDTIGVGYAALRKPDPRIAAQIHRALGDARTVLNVGAGAGSYEPTDRQVMALEPSAEMIRQRPAGAARAVQGVAEALPFADGAFDAAMAVLTVHHWTDLNAGLRELRRVAHGRVVILTFDADAPYFWLADYVPGLAALDRAIMPKLDAYAPILGAVTIDAAPIPHDCTDGFLGAFWRRPRAYLDPAVRAGMSSFAKIADAEAGLARLEADLGSGAWDARYGHVMGLESLDLGYRLIIAEAR
ncbi:MAG: methyltransferase domain-containing protein [Alphaproteobacteria bacterium]|nr:methyltransferase domain-containing protein [Alphaproteobacteria bacterium]